MIIQWLRPRFQVIAIDVGTGTMVLRQWNRTYTVKCERRCDEFAAGKSYSANDRGSDLEIKVAGHVVRCPIIKIEVRFETHPGGMGSYVGLGGTLRRSAVFGSLWLRVFRISRVLLDKSQTSGWDST